MNIMSLIAKCIEAGVRREEIHAVLVAVPASSIIAVLAKMAGEK